MRYTNSLNEVQRRNKHRQSNSTKPPAICCLALDTWMCRFLRVPHVFGGLKRKKRNTSISESPEKTRTHGCREPAFVRNSHVSMAEGDTLCATNPTDDISGCTPGWAPIKPLNLLNATSNGVLFQGITESGNLQTDSSHV